MIADSVLKDFNKKNIISWLKDLHYFFIKPRGYLDNKSKEKSEKLLPQYIFYFIIYTFSYLILSAATDFNELLRPSLLNLFVSIQFIFFFQLCCFLFSRKSYLKKIILLVFTWTFLISPLITILIAFYLGTEAHIYYTSALLANLISLLILFYGFSFFVEKSLLQSFKLLLSEILISTVLYVTTIFFLNNFNQDDIIFQISDPIYSEYSTLIYRINYDEKLPITNRLLDENKEIGKVITVGSLKNGNNSFNWDSASWIKFKIANKENLTQIQSEFASLQFQKNRDLATELIKYFGSIDTFIDNNYKMLVTQQNNHLLNYLIHDTSIARDIEFDESLFQTQLHFKAYNNSLIKSHKLDICINEFQSTALFIFGRIADSLLFKTVQINNEPFYKISS